MYTKKKFNKWNGGKYFFVSLINSTDVITKSFQYRKIELKLSVNGTKQKREAYVNDDTGSFYVVQPNSTMGQQDKEQEETTISSSSSENFQTVQTQLASCSSRIFFLQLL